MAHTPASPSRSQPPHKQIVTESNIWPITPVPEAPSPSDATARRVTMTRARPAASAPLPRETHALTLARSWLARRTATGRHARCRRCEDHPRPTDVVGPRKSSRPRLATTCSPRIVYGKTASKFKRAQAVTLPWTKYSRHPSTDPAAPTRQQPLQ